MADALVSSLVCTILTNLDNLLLGESDILGGLKSNLQSLESTLSTIQAVIHEAEEKQCKSKAVRNWLWKLKDAAYDADDVLDEFAIEAQRRNVQKDFKNRVRSFFSLDNPLVFHAKMAHKVKNVGGKLDVIASEKHKFHLTEGAREIEVADGFDWRQTSSLVNESEIYGRDKEKEQLVNSVLSNSDELSAYAVCGMGGLGKTTLAQLVYNDERVKSHFEMRIWVCVSDDFDLMRLTGAIIESIEGSPCHNQEFDPLQQRLQEKLSRRKYLLVLDDVWNENHDKWSRLHDVLRCGGRGSAVIITTRMEKIAVMMATAPVQHMDRLSNDDSLLLFERHAFGMRGREDFAHLEDIGKDIVKKCGGVPLAIKALGSMMRFKRNESEWSAIKGSNIWDMSEEGQTILPALKLSYDHLQPHLKQCLSFCALFPKDYAMKKDELVELWMANGFVSCRGQIDFFDMSHEIFSELVLRSFFEDVKEDFEGDITCKVHDLVHDLVQSVMKYESCFVEPNKALEVPKGVRYMAFHSDNYLLPIPKNKDLLKVQSLRSFLVFPGSWCDDIFPLFTKQKHLRALRLDRFHLSNFGRWTVRIGELKHLRYLDFSNSGIRKLPKSVTSLQKLQTLDLHDCGLLFKLPKGLMRVKDLINLDIRNCTSLTCMPAGIGQLTCLRKLSMFIVGKDMGQRIGELRRLNLEGSLSIKGLDNVENLIDARGANLISKKNLKSLELEWQFEGNGNCSTEKSEETLTGLQPHSNIKKLSIIRYKGSKFPDWMMDLLLPNLVEISLLYCNKCERLPPLGKLQFLKILNLFGMDAVKYIGSEIYGGGESAFTSLESLSLSGLDNLEEWAMDAGRNNFPRLVKLNVGGCSNRLVELPVIPSVKELKIQGENELLLSSVDNFPCITSLTICGFSGLTHFPRGFLRNNMHLEHLEIWFLQSLQLLPEQFNNLTALKCLKLYLCPQIESLPEGLCKLNSLETISIWQCGLVSFPVNGICGVASLLSLSIQKCHKFTCISEGVQYFTALEYLEICGCPQLNSFPKRISHLTALRTLSIQDCEGLSTLPDEIGCLTSLEALYIRSCARFNSLPTSIGHLASLQRLKISESKELSSLPNEIEYLTSLHRLYIEDCPNMRCLPERMQNLMKLRELRITNCPYLERRCQKGGEYWPRISHIPVICINSQLIQYSPP